MSSRFNILPRCCVGAKALTLCLLAWAACTPPARAQSSQDPVYVFHTTLGDMRVQLFPDVAPQTVANFLSYVNSGAYNSSIVHRVARAETDGLSVIQGGGFTVDANAQVSTIITHGAVTNEYNLPNTRGTIAMAKLGGDPNSATDQWFFNNADNSAVLNTGNNGGFTVFGKVMDTASLAVMDSIYAQTLYNGTAINPAFGSLPLINYQPGNYVTQANFVRVTSIVPAWTAISLSVGPDGNTHLLWDRGDGAATVWRLDSASHYLDQQNYGPYAGWTAKSVTTGPDNITHMLWSNASGQVTFWRLDSANHYLDQQNYGPYAGWSVASLSVGSDGNTRVVWDNVNGQSAFWLLDGQNRYVSQQNYGPYSGWTARSVGAGPDGSSRVLWTNVSGQATFWRVDSQNRYLDQQDYGPYSGWTAQTVSVGPDSAAHALWTNADGSATFWRLDALNRYVDQQNYGPYSGWAAVGLAASPDGTARALWANVSGEATLWGLDGANAYAGQQNYGPY